MPSLSYGIGAFDRDTGSLPELKCVNLFAEAARTSEGQVCLQSRPGLSTSFTPAAGAVRGIYSEPGVFGADIFTVIGTTLYRDAASAATSAIGSGTDLVSFAGTATELLYTKASGSRVKRYNGTAVNEPTFPDSASVRAVCVINFLFVAARSDGTYPGRFYWSAVNNGNSWDALDFATAERVPDDLLDVVALGDNIWLFGQTSLEVWQNTGNATLPFTRIEQVAFDKGIIATGAWAKADNSLFFIASDGVVYRAEAGSPVKVSEAWLNAKIRAASEWAMYAFERDGEEFVCVRLDGTTGTTWVLPVSTQKEWCEFQTNAGQWTPRCATMQGTAPYFGHQSSGAVMTFSGWTDPGTVAIDRVFSAATQLSEPLGIDNVRLWLNVGSAPTGVTPTLSMRYSRDAGRTFGSYITTDIGNAADGGNDEYRVRPEYRRLGMFDEPGALFEFKFSAASDFRVSAVKANEPGGGRSRA